MDHTRRLVPVAVAATLMLVVPTTAHADGIVAGHTEVVSFDTGGGLPNADVNVNDVSPNGRFVVLTSSAGDLVPGDTNGQEDVFVVDRLLGTTERVSVSSSEAQGSSFASGGSISDDGRLVAFTASDDALIAGDTNGQWDVLVRNRSTGTTTRVSTTTAGVQVVGQSRGAAISGNGAVVAFVSHADGLVGGETGADGDIFTKVLATGLVEHMSQSTGGSDGNGHSEYPSISADGRYVAFESPATNLVVAIDTNAKRDTFVRDRTTLVTTRVSVNNSLVQGNGDSIGGPQISADARYVAFNSRADNLVAGETGNLETDVFVHDRNTSTIQRVSETSSEIKGNGDSFGASISGDGDRVAFHTNAPNLGGAPGDYGLVVRDRSTGTSTPFPANPSGTDGGFYPRISPDGRYVGWDDSNADDISGNGVALLRVLAGDTFSDVPNSHPFFEEISWLVDNEITTGYPDDTYRPVAQVTRQAMAAFVERYLGSQFTAPATPTFSDVPTSHPFYFEIEWAAANGYVNGYDDGTFRPGGSITRQAAAAILYRVAGEPVFAPPGSPTFPDVPASHTFFHEIEWLASTGITGGFDDGTFRPAGAVTRQSTAAFLYRFLLVMGPP